MFSAPFRVDETRAPQNLQVPRGIGEAEMSAGGEFFDRARALGKVLKQFEAMRMAECLRDLGKTRINRLLGSRA